jgi:hypothetical protein
MGDRSIDNLQIGDCIRNVKTGKVYQIINYQWSFCPICVRLPHMKFCEKSKDPASPHYRFYEIQNVDTGKIFQVSGSKWDENYKNGTITEA